MCYTIPLLVCFISDLRKFLSDDLRTGMVIPVTFGSKIFILQEIINSFTRYTNKTK